MRGRPDRARLTGNRANWETLRLFRGYARNAVTDRTEMFGARHKGSYNRFMGRLSPRPLDPAEQRARRNRVARLARDLGFVLEALL